MPEKIIHGTTIEPSTCAAGWHTQVHPTDLIVLSRLCMAVFLPRRNSFHLHVQRGLSMQRSRYMSRLTCCLSAHRHGRSSATAGNVKER